MKKIFLGLLIFLLILSACLTDKTPFKIEETKSYPSHNFEWTADTLAPQDAFQVFMYDIWGTDENNVWCVGHSDLSAYQIWHWNGESWTNIKPNIPGDRPSYYEIFGFSENDFWIVGYANLDTGYVLHYDGNWQRVDNNELSLCMSVWGSSSENLFIGCNKGLIYKYDGQHFIRYETERNLQIHTIWGLDSGEIFAIGINNDNQPSEPPIRYLFKYVPDKFLLMDSLILTLPGNQTFGLDLWGMDMNNLYSPTGDGLTKYINGEWIIQFHSTTLYRIFGSSSNNIFTGGFQGIFYHYNGNDWKRLYFNDSVEESIWGTWCNDKFVFAIQHLGYYTRIWRGKQKTEVRR